MLPEEPCSRRPESETQRGLALPPDRARQKKVRHVGADNEQQHADEQHQDPQRVGVPGVQRIEATSARQRDELWNAFGAVRDHHVPEESRHLNPRGCLEILAQLARTCRTHQLRSFSASAVPACCPGWNATLIERGRTCPAIGRPEPEEPGWRDADNSRRYVVDADGAIEHARVAGEPVHPEPVADDDRRFRPIRSSSSRNGRPSHGSTRSPWK